MDAAAELVIVGLAGPRLEGSEARALRRLQPGGVILFGRNVEDAEQLHALVASLRSARPGVLLCVDGEGGRVHRLRQVVGSAPAAERLAAARPARARSAGLGMGRALRHFGFDVDFAPVVDLDRGFRGNALDGRYLGNSVRAVAARGRAFLRGLHAAGVAGCLKHFPGLGAAQADTHLKGAPIALSRDELAKDAAPFARLADLAGAVMVNHASYPALDASRLPATLSAPIATVYLRERLGFRGVSFSDDMEMKALALHGEMHELAAASLAAGCDVLALCGPRSLESLPAVVRELASPALRRRRDEALGRLRRYRRSAWSLRRAAEEPSLAAVRRGLQRLGAALDADA